ncbi:MAG: K+/H+ antiporter subunit F [Bradyrhizobium sp.]|uniref:K+/H+ antiporter subunit F n=1 Tax=Bradyrhizobium sp. TaxID=376 RepID=UPI00271A8407|nr:K+/H+ antiporter subunit F [Bradyrhizobium sp.]MDO9562282.1 K+/H+ antiporter subunit F [Bradyrhizobium sp.]MDP3693625.1 K+/H+ antiporter subunit F [Bradyrhizobium sp.]
MLNFVIPVALAMLAIAMGLNLLRLVKGPSTPDRILALDTLTINTIAVVMLIGITASSAAYFEAALLIAMMGFIGTVALCKFLLGGDIIE